MNVVIEHARSGDAEALLAFLRRAGSETDNLSFGSEGLPLTGEQEAAYIAGIEQSGRDCMLVAREGSRIIGNAGLQGLPRRMAHRAELSVAVLREYWGCGIGEGLMRALIDFARAQGYEILDVQVRSDNRPAICLYEKLGFTRLCSYPAFFKIENTDVDFDFMCLRLK